MDNDAAVDNCWVSQDAADERDTVEEVALESVEDFGSAVFEAVFEMDLSGEPDSDLPFDGGLSEPLVRLSVR